jgi:hypothetical protein
MAGQPPAEILTALCGNMFLSGVTPSLSPAHARIVGGAYAVSVHAYAGTQTWVLS